MVPYHDYTLIVSTLDTLMDICIAFVVKEFSSGQNAIKSSEKMHCSSSPQIDWWVTLCGSVEIQSMLLSFRTTLMWWK